MKYVCILGLLCAAGLPQVAAQTPGDVQKLVERLYPRNTRLKTIRMGDIVAEMAIRQGSQVADAGCGPGDFSVILANVVGPAGHVYCEDISESKAFGLPLARRHFKQQHVRNVTTIHGAADDPKLPAGSLDAVLIVNAYHEMAPYQAMLGHMRAALKPGGRLVIVDNTPLRTGQRPREKQTQNHVLSPSLAAAEVEAAGFRIVKRDDKFLDDPDSESTHWLIAAETSKTSTD